MLHPSKFFELCAIRTGIDVFEIFDESLKKKLMNIHPRNGVFRSLQWLVDKFRNRYVLLCCIYQASKAIREHAFVNWI